MLWLLTQHILVVAFLVLVVCAICRLTRLTPAAQYVLWLVVAMRIVWWWNPLGWLVRRRLRECSELACDEWVVRLFPDERRVYAESLVAVYEQASARTVPVPAIGARTGSVRAFQRRLTMIMNDHGRGKLTTWMWLTLGVVLLLVLPGFSWEKEAGTTCAESTEAAKPADPGDNTESRRAENSVCEKGGRHVSAPLVYKDLMLILTSDEGVAAIVFTDRLPEGRAYRFRFESRDAKERSSGVGRVFEKYKHTRVKASESTVVDDGGQRYLKAGPISVEWSYSSKDRGWLYYNPEKIRAQIGNASDFESANLQRFAADRAHTALDDRQLERPLECLRGHTKPEQDRVPADGQESKSDDSAAADSIWHRFGMRLEKIKLEAFERIAGRYRGGMKVVAVRPEGTAARQGIRKGDTLVGIHIWETVDEDDLDYILASDVVRKNQLMKFYVLRGDETLHGHFPPVQ